MYNEQELLNSLTIPAEAPLVAYIRISTNKQDTENQRNQIINWAFNRGISKERLTFIDAMVSSRKSEEERRLDEVYKLLGNNGVFVATEISRLGRSTSEVTRIIEDRLKLGNRLFFINQNLDLNPHGPFSFVNNLVVNIFAAVAQLERDLISQRTKMALAAKKANNPAFKIGRPKGIYPSMYDSYREKVKEYLTAGIPVNSIVKLLQKDYQLGSQRSLSYWIKKNKIIEELWKAKSKQQFQ